MRNKTLILMILLLSAALTACSAGPEEQTIRLALLPILDALPVHVAQAEGYFQAQDLQVEIIPVASAPERDQLVAAGEADGMINELVSTMFFNRDDSRIMIVRTARAATADQALFRILAAGDTGIQDPEGLKGEEIGVSEGTVIEYVTDRLLQLAGFQPDEINLVAVPRIPDRMSLLASGELPAAVLPDPLASLAIQNGAVVVVDDTSAPQFGLSVYSFRSDLLDENPQVVEAFLMAVEKAVEDINRQPEKYTDLLSEKQLVPEPLLEGYRIPPFPEAAVPTTEQWDDALDWTLENELLEGSLDYQDSVTNQYLP